MKVRPLCNDRLLIGYEKVNPGGCVAEVAYCKPRDCVRQVSCDLLVVIWSVKDLALFREL